jgi:hypothetical protein
MPLWRPTTDSAGSNDEDRFGRRDFSRSNPWISGVAAIAIVVVMVAVLIFAQMVR